MDGARFDAWTRRRFGATAAGMAATLLGVARPHLATASKKGKEKRRCKKLGAPCSRKKQCCRNRRCALTGELKNQQRERCCHTEGSCRSSNDCCRPFGCNPNTSRCEVP